MSRVGAGTGWRKRELGNLGWFLGQRQGAGHRAQGAGERTCEPRPRTLVEPAKQRQMAQMTVDFPEPVRRREVSNPPPPRGAGPPRCVGREGGGRDTVGADDGVEAWPRLKLHIAVGAVGRREGGSEEVAPWPSGVTPTARNVHKVVHADPHNGAVHNGALGHLLHWGFHGGLRAVLHRRRPCSCRSLPSHS